MNIVIISGGSGNNSLIRGLKSFYPEADIKVIVNAYDAGKSTGICRRVTNTLGVSDIRKNHNRMYRTTTSSINRCFVEFYDSRFDFTAGNELEEIIQKLYDWDLPEYIPYVKSFFNRPEASRFEYKDFNIANIVYAEMFAQVGYEVTNRHFCNILGIDDFVIFNSFDNVYIQGVTESGKILQGEEDIVEYCNPDDIIVRLNYISDCDPQHPELNAHAIEAINDADLIVISTGTFWSSIYPTLEYGEFYKFINNSSARKLWVMNCEPDKDCYGVGSNQLIQFVNSLGLDLSGFTIIENVDANELLREPSSSYNIVYESMGNHEGRHDKDKFVRALLKHYYHLDSLDSYSHVLFDFDDTLWSRAYKENPELLDISRKNIELVAELEGVASIVSGNTYSSILKKLTTVFGTDKTEFNIDIWADATTTLYRNGQAVLIIPELVFRSDDRLRNLIKERYGIDCPVSCSHSNVCIKIKPLTPREQVLLADCLNHFLLAECGLTDCKAVVAGKTTVDILSKNNTKSAIIPYLDVDLSRTLYIGDEVDEGNDKEISTLCGTSIHTSGVEETNALLRLLLDK